MDRLWAKLIAILIIFCVTIFCTVLPIKVAAIFQRKGAAGRRIISCFMCFGGGVFFATFMLHMGPEVRHLIHWHIEKPYNINYPLADLIIASGFFFILLCEKLTLKFNKSPHRAMSYTSLQIKDKEASIGMKLSEHSSDDNKPQEDNITSSTDDYNQEKADGINNNNKFYVPVNGEVKHENSDKPQYVESHHTGDHAHVENMHNTRSIILLLALSLHHVFEGISIGLQYDAYGVWSLCTAVILHEIVIAFSLGLQLVKSNTSKLRIVVYAILCSGMVPLGVSIAIPVMETGNTSSYMDMINGILQSVATGVFIYVTFFEILFDEFSHEDTSLVKVAFLVGGFTLMACLGLIPEGPPLNLYPTTACNCSMVSSELSNLTDAYFS